MVTITMFPDRVLRTAGLHDAPVRPEVSMAAVTPRAKFGGVRMHHVHKFRVRRLQVRRAVHLRVESRTRRVQSAYPGHGKYDAITLW